MEQIRKSPVSSGCFVTEEIYTQLCCRGVPRFTIVEGDPWPQMKPPTAWRYLLPTLYATEGNRLKG